MPPTNTWLAGPAPTGQLDRSHLEERILNRLSSQNLTVTRPGGIDGLLCWITLQAIRDGDVLDTLQQRTSWVPIYLPVFDEPVSVQPGDNLRADFARVVAADTARHPDYRMEVVLTGSQGTSSGHFLSRHHGGGLGGSAVYRDLFVAGGHHDD